MLEYIYDKPLRSWHTVKHAGGQCIESVGGRRWFRRCPRCKERMWSLKTFQRVDGRIHQVARDISGSWESICLFCDTRVIHAGGDIR